MKHNTISRYLWLPVLALAVTLAAQEGPQEVTPPPVATDARTLFRRGDRLVKERKYDEALRAWTRGYLERIPEYRDRDFLHPVPARFMEREKLREYIVEMIGKEYPDERIEADRTAYAHLGLLDRDLDLKETILDLLTEQVAGFYDPDTKSLYLIKSVQEEEPPKKRSFLERLFGSSSSFNAEEQRAVLSHELAHALADQHFDLHSMLQSASEDDDMALACAALVEGEAMLVMMIDMVEMSGGDGRQILKSQSFLLGPLMEMLISLGTVFSGSSNFGRAPLILRESLLFPYTRGFSFCNRLTRKEGWKRVDEALRAPPVSTEQVLHPEKYLPGTRDNPVALSFKEPVPLGERWERVKENVLGEFGIEVLLRPRLGRLKSRQASAGWDGDLFHIYRRKGAGKETTLAWASTWDSGSDAGEFADALIENYGVEGEEVSDVADIPGVPGAKKLWKSDAGLSGVWIRGADVSFLDRVPARLLPALARWSLQLERRPKELRIQKTESSVSFPDEGEK